MTAGFVLVGGRSARMGRDKALLPWRSRALVEHVAAKVAAAAGNVALVGNPQRYKGLGLECFADLRPGLGPLAGIETALAAKRGELNLIVACDMPGLETAWLRALLERAVQSDVRCVAARDERGLIHPLCAVYRSSCLPAIASALDGGRLRLRDMLQELPAMTVTIEQAISNVNTPEEWSAWASRERTRPGE